MRFQKWNHNYDFLIYCCLPGMLKKKRKGSLMQIAICLRPGHLQLFHTAVAFGEPVFHLSAFICYFEDTGRLGLKSLCRSKDKPEPRFLPVQVETGCRSHG